MHGGGVAPHRAAPAGPSKQPGGGGVALPGGLPN